MSKYNALITAEFNRFNSYHIRTYLIPQNYDPKNYGRYYILTSHDKVKAISGDDTADRELTLPELVRMAVKIIKQFDVSMIIVDVVGIGLGVFDILSDMKDEISLPIQPMQYVSMHYDKEKIPDSVKVLEERAAQIKE